ncbi:MAG TPA: DUF1629 domain-containing protein [Cellvibrio sp.]|nr:DUF1629 domain-containing protein [Cellvibrio sp.]
MLQTEYYVVERENNNNYPLFSWDQKENVYGLGLPVEYSEPLKFRVGEPFPPKLELVDFHETPEPVISFPLARILEQLDIYGIQLIPAKVRNPKDPFSTLHDYCFVHVWNRIACIDKVKSELEYLDDDDPNGMIFSIDKFVMDEEVLQKLELKKRLIFELAEKTSILLMHQSIKDAIESIKPKGIRFIPATQWNSASTFN